MSEYLKFTTVEVVQSIDLEALGKTLQWLVQRVQELPEPGTESKTIADSLLQDQIDSLRIQNQGLKEALQALQAKQDDLESRLDTKQDRDQAAAEAAAAGTGPAAEQAAALGELGKRLEQLEERVAAQEPAAPSDMAEQLQQLRQGQEALAASVSGLQSEVDAKPSRAELEGKASRSELDALLKAGVSPAAAAGGDAAAAPALAVGADGSLDNSALVEAVNRAAADVAAVRGQVAVLADRLGGKAEQAAVDDLTAKLGAAKMAAVAAPAAGSAVAAAVPSSAHAAASGEPAASASALNGLAQRVGELEARVAAGATATPSPAAAAAESAAAAAAADQAVDAIGALSDVQPLLKELFGKVEGKADRGMLGDALRKLQDLAAALEGKADAAAVRDLQARVAALPAAAAPAAAAAAAAASDGGQPQQEQQWVVSHEVKAGDGDSDLAAGLEELRGRVAALAAQVAALKGSRPPSAAAAGANGHVVPPIAAQLRSPSVSEGHDLASVQAALSSLHGQLGELSTRLAGKADGRDVAALELALNAKADLDELAELRLALGGKADGGALEALQVAVAGKPDQVALDEVKMMAATALDAAGSTAPAGEGGEGKPAAGGFSNLLDSVKGMVADRATKAELAALQSQLAGKASAEELAAVRAALDDKASAAEVAALGSAAGHAGRGANSEQIDSLDARMGDVFAEIAKIRADLAALPPADVLAAAAAGGGAGAGSAGGFLSAREGTPNTGADGAAASGGALARMVSALNREVGGLKEGLDTVAHAANVLAVGLDIATRGGGAGGVQGRYSESGGVGGGREDRSPRGGYERLLKLMGSGEYRMKMDAFDPTALQQMAQKLAYLEATLKSPAMGRIAAGGGAGGLPDMGIKDLERQVKRLATDARLLRDKLMDGSGGGGGGGGGTGRMMAPGDHAMLAARPITGYRCMACDRPLDQLDVLPGPHIPTQQLPIRVPAATDVATRGQAARSSARPGAGAGVGAGGPDPLSPQSSTQKLQYNTDPNVRGVQNWYKDATGMAAEALPPQHVGPHLPPGGWRPSNPGMGKLTGTPSLPTLNNAPKARSPATSEAVERVQVATPIMDGPANTSLPQIS